MSDTVFALPGAVAGALEALAFALVLGCVACNIREIHWGWPLAIVASLLYGVVFAHAGIYGEAWLQVFFATVAVWGWWQWLRGSRGAGVDEAGGASGDVGTPDDVGARRPLAIARLGWRRFGAVLVGWGVAWLVLGAALARWTDSALPYQDAFPTAGSVLAQVLLGRKYLENWWIWMGVNVASVSLFASRGLWLTAALYLLLFAMSVAGLRAWRARAAAAQHGPVAVRAAGAASRGGQ